MPPLRLAPAPSPALLPALGIHIIGKFLSSVCFCYVRFVDVQFSGPNAGKMIAEGVTLGQRMDVCRKHSCLIAEINFKKEIGSTQAERQALFSGDSLPPESTRDQFIKPNYKKIVYLWYFMFLL